MRSCSIFTGSLCSVRPSFRERRITWVSTTIPSALLKAFPSTTLAVFRATPGSASSSSMVSGTRSLYFSAMILQAAWMFLALLWWKLTLRISLSRLERSALAKSEAFLYFLKRSGVTVLTSLSVAWAERMVAIRSSSGLEWMRAVRGCG